MSRVRGTQGSVPSVEVGKADVRLRSNVVRVEEDEFVGWEYDEEVVSLHEYIDRLRDQISGQDGAIDDIVIALLGVV